MVSNNNIESIYTKREKNYNCKLISMPGATIAKQKTTLYCNTKTGYL